MALGRFWSRHVGICRNCWWKPGNRLKLRILAFLGLRLKGRSPLERTSELLIPKETDERLVYARRIIAQRCLYGVDKNPLAVEMAKLSLWLLTLAKDKPFEFLDHAIRCGDSLSRPSKTSTKLNTSISSRRMPIEGSLLVRSCNWSMKRSHSANRLIAMPVNTVEDVQAEERLLAAAEEKTARLRYAADLLLWVELQPVSAAAKEELYTALRFRPDITSRRAP